jgi:hypothetical protein
MNCVCGHPQKDHVPGGRCRVPDCPCELFRPGDTLRAAGSFQPGQAPGHLVCCDPTWGGTSAPLSMPVGP